MLAGRSGGGMEPKKSGTNKKDGSLVICTYSFSKNFLLVDNKKCAKYKMNKQNPPN